MRSTPSLRSGVVLTLAACLLFSVQGQATPQFHHVPYVETGLCSATRSNEARLSQQVAVSLRALRSAVSPVGGAPGSVMASPSRANPDYFYHWVRDASIVMRMMVARLDYELGTGKRGEAQKTLTQLLDFVTFSRANQATDNPSGKAWEEGLGEPKFEINGSVYRQSWGRPQNDGPALRAMAMMELAARLKAMGKIDYIRDVLYNSELPAHSPIKADLEFVAHHWRDPSFDIWEENIGDHFFTRIVQFSALRAGSDFARWIGDRGASDFYAAQARAIFASLSQFWDPQRGYLVVTRARQGGLGYKESGLDSAVLLGILQAEIPSGPFSVVDERVIATVDRLERVFQALYPINQVTKDPAGLPLAPAIGRYPEDRYDGYRTNGKGNPWFIATQAMAEYYFRVAKILESSGSRPLPVSLARLASKFAATPLQGTRDAAKAFRERGEAYLRRAMIHTDSRGHQSEQINRDNGYMQGAIDLTWNYASFLSAMKQRSVNKPPVRLSR